MGKQPRTRPGPFGLSAVIGARRNYQRERRAPTDVVAFLDNLEEGDPLVALADAQHGVVHVSQLKALGYSPQAIHRRRLSGAFTRVHPRVYAVGRATLDQDGTDLAGVLAIPPPSLLAHRSALTRWGALPASEEPLHVITSSGHHGRGELELHRTASLHPDDCCALDLIPLTAPARSLLDFATAGDRADLQRALNELRVQQLIRDRDLEQLLSLIHI